MGRESPQYSPVFSIDVAASQTPEGPHAVDAGAAVVALLRQLVSSQERQSKILEQLLAVQVAAQKQRATELQQWREANPHLAKSCRRAAESLSRVQSQFIEQITEEIESNEEALLDGEFVLSEFVDRFGPRLAHLNGVLQVLAQLSSVPTATPN